MIAIIGICKLCLKETNLTFEHIPPKSTGNNKQVKVIKGNELILGNMLPWKVDRKKLKQLKAMGDYSFCSECNNLLGAKYVNSFKDFNNKLPYLTEEIYVSDGLNYLVEFSLEDIKPLNILKHIFSMFIAINSIGWIKTHEDIRQFVLQPELKQIPDYVLGYYIRRGNFRGDIHIPHTIICEFNEKNILINKAITQIDMIKAGYYLQELSMDLEFGTNLLDYFIDFDFNQVASFYCKAIAFERNVFFPMDFRKKSDFDQFD